MGDSGFLLEHQETRKLKQVNKQWLLGQFGKVVYLDTAGLDTTLQALSDEDRELLAQLPCDMHSNPERLVYLSRARWIRQLKLKGVTTRDELTDFEIVMEEVRGNLPAGTRSFTPRTLKEQWIKYEASGENTRVLMPSFAQRGGPGRSRLHPAVHAQLIQRIELERPKTTRLLPKDLWELHQSDVIALNAARIQPQEADGVGHQPPHSQPHPPAQAKPEPLLPADERTVRRFFIKSYDAYDMKVRNYNKAKADRDFRNAGARIRADEPLVATQFDDTDGEVFLIDGETGLPWGRAFLTIGVDECSAAILGTEISHQYRDTWSALSAIVNAILPKDLSEDQYAYCENRWFPYGKIGIAQFDNALYNRAKEFFEGAVVDAQALPGWSKPRTPTGKTQIENVNNILKIDFTPYLPGWRGPKRDRDGLKEGPGTAILTIQEYKRLYFQWVADRYHNKPRERGKTPQQIWFEHFRNQEPRMPMDTEGFKLISTLRRKYTLRDSGGVLRLGLRYNSASLEALRDRIGAKEEVEVRVRPFDLSQIYVFNPLLRRFIIVPCIEPLDYIRGLTNRQQQLILKQCRADGKKNPSVQDCAKARQQLAERVAQLQLSRRLHDRLLALQLKEGNQASGATTDEAADGARPAKSTASSKRHSTQTLASELERQMDELGEVSLEDNEIGYQDDEQLLAA